jgi:hypothetical protein
MKARLLLTYAEVCLLMLGCPQHRNLNYHLKAVYACLDSYSLLLDKSYVWVSLGNAMKAKQKRSKAT